MATNISADDRFAIEQLLSSYGVYHDAREFESLQSCFTDDARYSMEVAGQGAAIERHGSQEIVEQIKIFKRRQHDQRRHVITNFMFEGGDVDRVNVCSYVTVLAVAGEDLQVVSCGMYRDVVVRAQSGWRIAEKSLRLDKSF